MNSLRKLLPIVFCVMATVWVACTPEVEPTKALTPVTLQLKWIHQAQFAGFYVAASKGFYLEENIDIKLIPGGVGIDIVDEVTSGRADFGLIGAEKIIIARSQGHDVRAIATTYRQNPYVLVTMPNSGIETPYDFVGKSINVGGTDGMVQFTAMISKLGLDIHDMEILPYSYDLGPFYQGEIDITPALAAGSLIGILQQHPDVNLIWPVDYGIHLYSDTLFCTDEFIEKHSDLIVRFVRATLKGHQYAIANPEEAAQISLKYAQDPDPDLQWKMVVASIPLINTGEDHLGWMREAVWEEMQSILLEQGLIPRPLVTSNFYTLQFLETIYNEK